jgi:glutamate synthase domain-containing protein 1
MCGITGLFLKNRALEPELGALFEPMLLQMSQRGPDSAGFAIYRDRVPAAQIKVVMHSVGPSSDWAQLAAELRASLDPDLEMMPIHSHCLMRVAAEEERVIEQLEQSCYPVSIVSIGRHIEIYKEVGTPEEVARCFGLQEMTGSHAIGHTRMATESAVTTAGSHPFSTGNDVCLVHNGSLSNHNRLRRNLIRQGAIFKTDNDTEVAAQYFDVKLQQGASLEQAMSSALSELDGFYTFCIGTSNGFAVLRDPIACKPAVMAETGDWVAIGSEFRALAELPDIGHAEIWEPEPAVPYLWENTTEVTAAAAQA